MADPPFLFRLPGNVALRGSLRKGRRPWVGWKMHLQRNKFPLYDPLSHVLCYCCTLRIACSPSTSAPPISSSLDSTLRVISNLHPWEPLLPSHPWYLTLNNPMLSFATKLAQNLFEGLSGTIRQAVWVFSRHFISGRIPAGLLANYSLLTIGTWRAPHCDRYFGTVNV